MIILVDIGGCTTLLAPSVVLERNESLVAPSVVLELNEFFLADLAKASCVGDVLLVGDALGT